MRGSNKSKKISNIKHQTKNGAWLEERIDFSVCCCMLLSYVIEMVKTTFITLVAVVGFKVTKK